MQKIPSLFLRDTVDPSRLSTEVDRACQWVVDGHGLATEKTDGTACRVRRGLLWKRMRVRPDGHRPAAWCHWTDDTSIPDGHGWIPVYRIEAADRWHVEAFTQPLQDGTYELIGPKVQGNPYGLKRHALVRHGSIVIPDPPVPAWGAIISWLNDHLVEGIVWHHPDGRMAKVKRRDFGLPWPAGGNAQRKAREASPDPGGD